MECVRKSGQISLYFECIGAQLALARSSLLCHTHEFSAYNRFIFRYWRKTNMSYVLRMQPKSSAKYPTIPKHLAAKRLLLVVVAIVHFLLSFSFSSHACFVAYSDLKLYSYTKFLKWIK